MFIVWCSLFGVCFLAEQPRSFLFDPFLAHAREEEEEEANIWAYFSEFCCEDIVIMASMKLSPKKGYAPILNLTRANLVNLFLTNFCFHF